MMAMKKYVNRLNLLCLIFLCAAISTLYSSNKKDINYSVPLPTNDTVTTGAISDITSSTATCSAKISLIGADFINCGVCWDVKPDPTLQTATNYANTFNKSTSFSIALTGLSGGIIYYARAYMVTISKVIYGEQVSFTTVTPPITIGESYAGGIIFYIDNTGKHGLVASPADLSAGVPWDNGNWQNVVGNFTTGTAVGSGLANTAYIISKLNSTGTYAALSCKKYNINGFTDWFLPSRDELLLMKQNLYDKKIGNFTAPGYWSSSAYQNSYYAYMQNVSADIYSLITMDNAEAIRAARAF
jgi:hypothetical protein